MIRRCFYFVVIFLLTTHCAVHANSEQALLDAKLSDAIFENDIVEFRNLLISGADPNWVAEGGDYMSSALCEATKIENRDFLEAIVQYVDNLEIRYSRSTFDSPASCAIMYVNFDAYKTLVTMGLDVSVVLNPEAKISAQRTLLDLALNGGKADIMWDIIQQTEPSDEQISSLVRSLEIFGGFEGHSNRTDRLNIAQWLRERGVAVNIAPAIPDPRTITR